MACKECTLTCHVDRFDRFRLDLKGTWKDLPLEGNGLVYDLAAHTLDQALILFGRPTKLTAFRENIRGAGSKDVDDTVSTLFPSLFLSATHAQRDIPKN